MVFSRGPRNHQGLFLVSHLFPHKVPSGNTCIENGGYQRSTPFAVHIKSSLHSRNVAEMLVLAPVIQLWEWEGGGEA